MSIRRVLISRVHNTSTIRPEFHGNSYSNGYISQFDRASGLRYADEDFYVHNHPAPLEHYLRTGEVPVGYALAKDETLYEGAVVALQTEERRLMSDVYGTVWIATVWNGTKFVFEDYDTDINDANFSRNTAKIDATEEVLEKWEAFQAAEREEAKRQEELAAERAQKAIEKKLIENRIARAKQEKGTIVEIVKGKHKPKQKGQRQFGIITAYSKIYNTFCVALTKRKGDLVKNDRKFRNVHLDTVWVSEREIDVTGFEFGDVGMLAAAIAWEHDKDIIETLEVIESIKDELQNKAAKIDAEFSDRDLSYDSWNKRRDMYVSLARAALWF